MPSGPSLAGRAILALLLMVGFYALALGVAALLLLVVALEFYVGHVSLQITILCGGAAVIIVWSILPRFDRFNPPWPRLSPEEHPRLFAEIQDVAKATGQEMPVEVYLDPDVNAWVAQRGGIMGLGSRRVMGIGLPLLAVVSVPQLRAVLAHEFGHYCGGDTKLGPWVYKTRAAIIRTINNMARSRYLHRIFVWYGKLYLRITHGISRQQELAADALGARVAGAATHASALRRIHRAGVGFQPYVSNELNPVLGAGYLPPVAAGFTRFLAASPVAEALDKEMAKDLKGKAADPYDTHPPLRERLAAIGVADADAAADPGAEPPAIGLLENVPALEERLLKVMVKKNLKSLDWDAVGPQVYIPAWTKLVTEHGKALQGVTPADLPQLAADAAALANRFAGTAVKPADRLQLAVNVTGAALAMALQKQGWTLHTEPGAKVAMRKEGAAIEPFSVLSRLANGVLTADAWRQTCAAAGLSTLDLGAV